MAGFARCTICKGFLHYSYCTSSGIDVYRCNAEDSWNDKGRYFIFAAGDVIEVEPSRTKSRDWGYTVVDTENRRRQKESDNINADLKARQERFRKGVAEMYNRATYTEKYEGDD